MSRVHPGRFTAEVEDPLVVFLIGMRVNKLWKVWAWLPVFLAMFPMMARLVRDPESPLRSYRMFFTWRQVMLVQYWDDFQALEAYARDPEEVHVPAWQRYQQRIGGSGDVGVWHETYVVEPGTTECVYANMPELGLPAATEHVPATGERATARDRLNGHPDPRTSARSRPADPTHRQPGPQARAP